MNRSRKSNRTMWLRLLFALLLVIIPTGEIAADYCYDLFCPLGEKFCSEEQKKQIRTCRKIDVVGNGIDAANDTLDDIDTAFQTVDGEFQKLQSDMNRVLAGMEDVSDTALFFNEFTKVIDQVSTETLTMTENLAAQINEARRLADFYLQRERTKYLAFTTPNGCGYECVRFRQDLIGLIDDIETTFNLAIEATLVQMPADLRSQLVAQPRIDLTPLRLLIENVPGVLLYPMHEAFAAMNGSDAFASRMRRAGVVPMSEGSIIDTMRVNLARMRDGLISMIETAAYWVNDGGTSLCVAIAGMDPDARKATTITMAVIAVVAHIVYEVGDGLEAVGFTAVDVQGAVDFAVFAGKSIKARPARTTGKFFKAIATLALLVTDTTSKRFHSCTIIMDQQTTLCVLHNNKAKSFNECRRKVMNGERFGF